MLIFKLNTFKANNMVYNSCECMIYALQQTYIIPFRVILHEYIMSCKNFDIL